MWFYHIISIPNSGLILTTFIVCMFSVFGPSASQDTDQESVGETETEFENGITPISDSRLARELLGCGWKRLVILSDKDIDDSYLDFLVMFKKIPIPFSVYQIGENDASAVIYEHYVVKGVTNILIISEKVDMILDEMNELFLKYSKSFLSAFPHRTNWVILTNGFEVNASDSMLDNLAVVNFKSTDTGSIRTLMWREGRTREWENIERHSLGTSKCLIYPNMKNGLNGRHISWLTVPFSYGSCVQNDSSGNPRYSGFFIDVVRLIGEMVNYTTDFVPPPASPIPMAVHNFDTLMYDFSADFGLNLYSQDFAVNNGLQIMYHLYLDPTVAAYIYKPTSDTFRLSFTNFGNFKFPVQVTIVTAFVYAVLFYKFLSVLTPYANNNKDMRFLCHDGKQRQRANKTSTKRDLAENKKSFAGHRYGKFHYEPNSEGSAKQSPIFDRQNTSCTNHHESFVKRLYRAVGYLYRKIPDLKILPFFGSHMNQSTIMRPEQISSRVFIFFWCVYVLIITNLFTGTLTANLIKPKESPPFTSVAEILQSKEVTYGTFYETELATKSESWLIDGKDWTGRLEHFPINFTVTPKEFRKFMETDSGHKPKVFVYYKHVIRYLKHRSQFDDLYITKDYFHHAVLSFVAPNNSEIVDFVSPAMAALHQSDIIRKMAEPYLGSRFETQTTKKTNNRSETRLSVLTDVFYAMAGLTAAAILALGVEMLIHYTGACCVV